jgi:hypothetical protein
MGIGRALVALLLLAVPRACSTPSAPPDPGSAFCAGERPPPELTLGQMERERDLFVERAAAAGMALPFTPAVRGWTRPSLMSWRQRDLAVAVPAWVETSAAQRAVLEQLFGSPDRARCGFGWLFRWFLLPHELAHAVQDAQGAKLPHAQSERIANDVAVAFWAAEQGGEERLSGLQAFLEARPPSSPPSDADVDARYDVLPLAEYGAFQLAAIRDSLARRQSLRFADALSRLRAP